ncbi:uncharacterized protein ACO6RY_17264 [Pungitius sinensis]
MADGKPVTTTPNVPAPINATVNATVNTTTLGAVDLAHVINWLTLSIGLPAIGLAIYALRNLSKGENKIPMHVVFLLVSDVLSFFGRPAMGQDMASGPAFASNPTDFLFYFGVITNITLMLAIAQERHLLVFYPRCLGCCGAARRSPAVTLATWAAPFAVLALAVLRYDLWFAACLLAPFPLLLFFAVDSCRALLCSRSPARTPERRRAAWGIAAIWANYTFLYVPYILSILLEALSFKETVTYLGLVSHLLLYLGPLVDPFLYIFMTRGLKEVVQALPCCHRHGGGGNAAPTVDTVAEAVETRL